MTALLRHFYAFMVFWTQFELTLYRSTSGNMALINRTSERLNYWVAEAQRFEWQHN